MSNSANEAARQLGRLGGKVTSKAKTLANRAKSTAYWQAVRDGRKPAPKHRKGPRKAPNAARKAAKG